MENREDVSALREIPSRNRARQGRRRQEGRESERPRMSTFAGMAIGESDSQTVLLRTRERDVWVKCAGESDLRSGHCILAFDPQFSTLFGLIPDELRPHLTGLTAAVSYPTDRSHAVFRLVGEWEGDVFLKVLDAKGANYNSLRDEAMRLEWLAAGYPSRKSLRVARAAATSSCLLRLSREYRRMTDRLAGIGKRLPHW
jgi:hypothetical protein